MVLHQTFYQQPTLEVAQLLLGCELKHETPEGVISGRIVETEAYMGSLDLASHSYRGQTKRNAVMFGPAGRAYVYFTYGMHYCFNAVCSTEGVAEAVLIRALEPLEGMELMERNRGTTVLTNLCSGPAKLVQALGITKEMNGIDLTSGPLTIHDAADRDFAITATSRIGIREATEHQWRYFINGNQFVSKGKPSEKK